MLKQFCLTTFLFICSFFTLKTVQAQTDSTRKINWNYIDAKSNIDTTHSPKRAGIYSALLPGLGQAYNKKYWKLPIVYGLGGFIGFKIVQNQRNYVAHRDELFRRNLSADTPEIKFEPDPEFEGLSDGLIQTRKDVFRESRDKFIVFSALFYGANILDAVVDAHLTTFKVGKGNELSFKPTLIPTETYATGGLELKLRF